MYTGLLIAQDGRPITERTGTSVRSVTFSRLPKDGDYIPFFYMEKDTESPGVCIATDNVEIEGNVYLFSDIDNRVFKLEIIKE